MVKCCIKYWIIIITQYGYFSCIIVRANTIWLLHILILKLNQTRNRKNWRGILYNAQYENVSWIIARVERKCDSHPSLLPPGGISEVGLRETNYTTDVLGKKYISASVGSPLDQHFRREPTVEPSLRHRMLRGRDHILSVADFWSLLQ